MIHLDNQQFLEWIQLLIFTKPFWDNDEAHAGMVEGRADFDADPVPQPLHGLKGQSAACQNHDVVDQLAQIAAPCLVRGVFGPWPRGRAPSPDIPREEEHTIIRFLWLRMNMGGFIHMVRR